MNQPTAQVGAAATIGAAVAVLVTGILHRLHVDLTGDEQGAITVLVVGAVSALAHRKTKPAA
jgi:H+/Cl- antiporter ClcA